MGTTLQNWVAQSESWHSFVDFCLPLESLADYDFAKRPDDFYIALLGRAMEVLDQNDEDRSQMETLALAKGLEIYSLETTKGAFWGVDVRSNMLYAASLYYLAGYSASALLLARLYEYQDDSATRSLLGGFLARQLRANTEEQSLLSGFLDCGDHSILDELIKRVSAMRKEALITDADAYIACKFTETVLKAFHANAFWNNLPCRTQEERERWRDYARGAIQRSPGMWEFFPSQRKAISLGALEKGRTVSLQMPTSSGKTALCELLIYNEVKFNQSGKVLLLAPFRSLASELKSSLARQLALRGITVKAIYGGNAPTASERDAIQAVDVLIATPEKFMAVEAAIPGLCNAFQTVICDEGHLLDSDTRGLGYELLLSKFMKAGGEHRKFIFLSAIIPNIEMIHNWLGGDPTGVIKSNYKPTELELGLLRGKESQTRFVLEVNPGKPQPQSYFLYDFLTIRDFQYINPVTGRRKTYGYKNSNKAIAAAVALKSSVAGPVALFAPEKGGQRGVTGLGEEIIEQLKVLNLPRPSASLDANQQILLRDLEEYCRMLFGDEYLLTRLIPLGVAFHHGDLPQDVREAVEDGIQSKTVAVVLCTSTLAEGVNLPIRTLVVYSTKRFDSDSNRYVPIYTRDLKNIVGRAGRAGRETKGMAIFVASDDFGMAKRVFSDVGAEKVTGALYQLVKAISDRRIVLSNALFDQQAEDFKKILDDIDTSLITLLAEEIDPADLAEEVARLAEITLAHHQSNEDERATLKTLFDLRADKLRPTLETGAFKSIKASGTTPRLHDAILQAIDFNSPLWTSTDSPVSETWVDCLFGILSQLPQFTYQLDITNRSISHPVDVNTIRALIVSWLNGATYREMANESGLAVVDILKLVGSLIGYHIQNLAGCVCRLAKNHYVLNGGTISQSISEWPTFLQHGVNSRIHLDLIDLGFCDRLSVWGLGRWIDTYGIQYETPQQLRDFLVHAEPDQLISAIESFMPTISLRRTMRNIEYLTTKSAL